MVLEILQPTLQYSNSYSVVTEACCNLISQNYSDTHDN